METISVGTLIVYAKFSEKGINVVHTTFDRGGIWHGLKTKVAHINSCECGF